MRYAVRQVVGIQWPFLNDGFDTKRIVWKFPKLELLLKRLKT